MSDDIDLIPDNEHLDGVILDQPDPSETTHLGEVMIDLPDTPEERAQERFKRLQVSFSAVLTIVAEMYRDEDWRYLTRDDGTPYATLAEVIAEAVGVGLSMARRYVQGARDFLLPLSSIVVDGTSIEITSGEIATLGKDGLRDVVATIDEQLDGVNDPEESTAIIRDTIEEAKASKAKKAPADSSGGPSELRPDDFAGESSASRSKTRGDDGPDPDDYDGDLVDDVDTRPVAADAPEDDIPVPQVAQVDPEKELMEGACDYTDPGDFDTLPDDLVGYVTALRTILDTDPVEVSDMLTYDSRGVLGLASLAQDKLASLRTNTITQPWYLSQLG